MTRNYLVLVDGKLAKRRKSLGFALKDKKEMEAKGMKLVSIAKDITKETN